MTMINSVSSGKPNSATLGSLRGGVIFAVSFLLATSGCQSQSDSLPKESTAAVSTVAAHPTVNDGLIQNAVNEQRRLMREYVERKKFGDPLPELKGDALQAHLVHCKSQIERTTLKNAVHEEFVQRKKEMVIPAWIEFEYTRQLEKVKALATSASAAADSGKYQEATKIYEEAREIVWRSFAVARLDGELYAEVNDEVHARLLAVLEAEINPVHWRYIEREMRFMVADYSRNGEFKEGAVELAAYPLIRTYTVLLDEGLEAVRKELVRLGLPQESLKPITESAHAAMREAANLADKVDEIVKSENKTLLDDGYNPESKTYRDLLKKFHENLILYGCTKDNAERIVKEFSKNLDDMIVKLRRDPKYGKDFLVSIKRLGASAINARIEKLRKELAESLKRNEAAYGEVMAKIDDLLKKGNALAAGDEAVKLLKKYNGDDDFSKLMRNILLDIRLTRVNPAIWEKIRLEFEKKIAQFTEKGDAVGGVAWISAYPWVRTYAEEIDEQYAKVVAVAVASGVSEERAKAIMDRVSSFTVRAKNLYNDEDRIITRVVKAKKMSADEEKRFEREVEACSRVLQKNGCTEKNADLICEAIRKAFGDEFLRLRTDRTMTTLVLGANAINDRLRRLKLESARKLIVDCAAEYASDKKYDQARKMIRDIQLTDDETFDAEMYICRVGVLNALINPYQYITLADEMKLKVKGYVRAGDYSGLKEWVLAYPGVHDDYGRIRESLEALRKAIDGIGVDMNASKSFALKTYDNTNMLLERFRTNEYERVVHAVDLTNVDKQLSNYERMLLEQYHERDQIEKVISSVRKNILKMLDKDVPKTMTTFEMNEKLKDMLGKIIAAIADLEGLIANQKYLEMLAKADAELSFDSQIQMAEDAIAKQLSFNCSESHLKANAVLGEYARVMRLLKMNKKLSDEEKAILITGAVYLDQTEVYKFARELKANVNGVSRHDPLMRTPLLFALQTGRSQWVKKLAEDGAFLKVADAQGNTALHYAVRLGHVALVRLMKEKNPVVCRNIAGETALHHAALRNQKNLVAALLEANQAVNATDIRTNLLTIADSKGMTAMDIACSAGSCDVLDNLEKAGAKYGPRQLALAAASDRLGVVQWLVNHGVDVNADGVMVASVCMTATREYLTAQGGVPPSPCKCRVCSELAAKAAAEAAEAAANAELKDRILSAKPVINTNIK